MGQITQESQLPTSRRNTILNGYGTIFKRIRISKKTGWPVTTMYVRARLGQRRIDPETGGPLVTDDTDELGRPRYVLADYGLDPVRIAGNDVAEIVSERDYSLGAVLYIEPAYLGIYGSIDNWTVGERRRWAAARDHMAAENHSVNQEAREMLRAILAIRAAQLDSDLDVMDFDAVVPSGRLRLNPP